MMDTQILRKPAAGQVWKNDKGTYFHVVGIANEEHKHEDHPVDVVYRSMRLDNGQPSHWWTAPLLTWHEKMTFVAEHNDAVPPVGVVYEVRQGPLKHNWGVQLLIDWPPGISASDVGLIPGSHVRVYSAPRSAMNPYPPPGAKYDTADVCPATGGKHLVRHDRTVRGGYGCIRCGEPG